MKRNSLSVLKHRQKRDDTVAWNTDENKTTSASRRGKAETKITKQNKKKKHFRTQLTTADIYRWLVIPNRNIARNLHTYWGGTQQAVTALFVLNCQRSNYTVCAVYTNIHGALRSLHKLHARRSLHKNSEQTNGQFHGEQQLCFRYSDCSSQILNSSIKRLILWHRDAILPSGQRDGFDRVARNKDLTLHVIMITETKQ